MEPDYSYNRHKGPSKFATTKGRARRERRRKARVGLLNLQICTRGNQFTVLKDGTMDDEPGPGDTTGYWVYEANTGVYARRFSCAHDDLKRAKELNKITHSVEDRWDHQQGGGVIRVFKTWPTGERTMIYEKISRTRSQRDFKKQYSTALNKGRDGTYHTVYCRCIGCKPWLFDTDGHYINSYYSPKLYEGVDRVRWPNTWRLLVKFQHMNNSAFTRYVSGEELAERRWRANANEKTKAEQKGQDHEAPLD